MTLSEQCHSPVEERSPSPDLLAAAARVLGLETDVAEPSRISEALGGQGLQPIPDPENTAPVAGTALGGPSERHDAGFSPAVGVVVEDDTRDVISKENGSQNTRDGAMAPSASVFAADEANAAITETMVGGLRTFWVTMVVIVVLSLVSAIALVASEVISNRGAAPAASSPLSAQAALSILTAAPARR